MKVRNMISKKGNTIPNQFIIETDDAMYFQSYDSIIAKVDYDPNGKTYLDEIYWDYSVTTAKYRNQFLNQTKKEIQENIKTGKYILANLN